MAALALGVPLVIAGTVPPLIAWRRGAHDEAAALAGALSAQVVDAIHGAPDLLAFGADTAALARIEALQGRSDALARGEARSAAMASLLISLCSGLAVAAVLAVAVDAVHAHHLDPVMVAVLPLAALATFEPIPGVTLAVGRAMAAAAAARRLFALDAVPVPVLDPAVPAPFPGGVPELSFRHASLRYADGLPRALDTVSLQVAPGDTVAVTGSSGAGKSSLVNALLRFWPLEDGDLTLGGIPAEQLAQAEFRAACALVDQRAQLFAGTLRSNVTLGRPEATEDEIAVALAAAQLSQWVATLPAGLDTPVGNEGMSISGGERRRVAVARALLAGGRVLVLDEPTSGLDVALADQLLNDVLTVAEDRSVLLITHRVGEAARCTTTITLEAGRVVD